MKDKQDRSRTHTCPQEACVCVSLGDESPGGGNEYIGKDRH